MNHRRHRGFLWVLVGLSLTWLNAQPAAAERGQKQAERHRLQAPPPGPPPEAVEACVDQSEGAECRVEIPAREVVGSCAKSPQADLPLACLPDDMPAPPPPADDLSQAGDEMAQPGMMPPPPPGPAPVPPPEAVAACKEQREGDGCLIELTARAYSGRCAAGPQPEQPMACMPDPPAFQPGKTALPRKTGAR